MELLFFSLIFCIYILIKNIKKLKIILLSTSLIIFLIYAIAHNAVNSDEYNFLKTILFNHFTPFYLLAGPFFYFFIKSTTNNNFKFKKRHLIHLIPFIIQCIAIHEYIMIPWETKMKLVSSFYLTPENQADLKVSIFFSSKTNYIIRFFQLTAYLTASMILLNKIKYVNYIKQLKRITLIMFSVVVLYYVHILLIITNGIYNTILIKTIINTDIFLLFLLILEFIKSPELYLSLKKINKSYLNESPFSKTKNKKLISENDRKKIALKIEEIKNNKHFLLNSDNSFRDFASFINFPDHIIRIYLKSENTSYMDIKNKVRLSHAKKLLEETKLKYNLNYIAEKTGFNSRSNFYSIFKKYEKCTPRDYLNKKKLL
jgi:hypothetical protein